MQWWTVSVFGRGSILSHADLFKLQTDWDVMSFSSNSPFSILLYLIFPDQLIYQCYNQCMFILWEQCCMKGSILMKFNMWGCIFCCISGEKYWQFTKKDLISLFFNWYHQCMFLCFCHECWIFIWGDQRLSVASHHTPQIHFYYFKLQQLDVSLKFHHN